MILSACETSGGEISFLGSCVSGVFIGHYVGRGKRATARLRTRGTNRGLSVSAVRPACRHLIHDNLGAVTPRDDPQSRRYMIQ
jgi:hypothetical protein